MRWIAYYWALLGVTGLLASAVWRLTPRVLELDDFAPGPLHWLVLAVFTPYMAYAEGYKGFHLNFAPRVVARALYLRDMPAEGNDVNTLQRVVLTVLAPAFCMGYFHATRRRRLVSWLVSSAIVLLVLGVSRLPQPWRGVVTGLAVGIASLAWHWLRAARGTRPAIALDLPAARVA